MYIYPYVVQTKVRGVTYMPASKYFAEVKGFIPPVNAWNIHKVIRMSFVVLVASRKKKCVR